MTKYMHHNDYNQMMHILLTLITITYAFQNTTKLRIRDEPLADIINTTSRVKITFISQYNIPFELILYTTSGIPLHYKGTHVSYTGYPTFYHINGKSNKIIFNMYEMETDWIKVISALMAIGTISVLIIYKRDHRISQICLFVLLTSEIYQTTDYEKVAGKIIHKILF